MQTSSFPELSCRRFLAGLGGGFGSLALGGMLSEDASGARCLMARRFIEAGVRHVQVFPPLKPSLQPWEHQRSLKSVLQSICAQTDQPSAARIQDLKYSAGVICGNGNKPRQQNLWAASGSGSAPRL